MNLANLFGDDEHTAADGPYKRVMKTRKWIYISASLGLLVAGGRYHETGGNKVLLEVFSFPDYIFALTLIAGLAYLLPLYVILVAQLCDVYSAVVDERFADQRLERLREASKRRAHAVAEISNWVSSWRRAHVEPFIEAEQVAMTRRSNGKTIVDRLGKGLEVTAEQMADVWKGMATPDLKEFLSQGEDARENWLLDWADQADRNYLDAAGARVAAEIESPPEDDAGLKLLRTALAEADSDLANLANVQAYLSPGYRRKETIIDAIRIAPPLMTGVLALAGLVVNFAAPIFLNVLGLRL